MEPLAVPPASQPLARVDKFVYLWSSHGPAEGCGVGPPYAMAGAGGVDVIGSDKGVTVWRPQPPMGYALMGDVLSAGNMCNLLGGLLHSALDWCLNFCMRRSPLCNGMDML